MTTSMTNLDAPLPSLEHPSGVRGAVAMLFSAMAVGLIALTALGGGRGPVVDAYLVTTFTAGLWLVAVLAVAPELRSANGIALAATLLYGSAFALPALTGEGAHPVPGYLAFYLGWLVVPIAWLANPIFVVALYCYRRAQLDAAMTLALIAFLAALTTLLAVSRGSASPGVGFWFWAAAPAILVFASLVRSIAKSPVVEAS